MSTAYRIGVLYLAALSLPSIARAEAIADGLDYRVNPGAFSGGPVHVLEIDLTRYRLIQTDPEAPLQRSAAAFASSTGSLAVTNSNFYVNPASGPPVGLLVGRGHTSPDAALWYQPPTFQASIGVRFEDGFAAAFSSAGLLHGPAPDCMSEVFTGSEWALRNGVVATTSPSTDQGLFGRHPRTVLGLSQDRQRAFVFVTQGRGIPSGALGYQVVGQSSIGHIALSEGAYDAINLDGGGSSAMWIDALGGIKNQPTDGQERLVAYHLGVVPAPADEPIPEECRAQQDAGPTVTATDAAVNDDTDAGAEEGNPPLRSSCSVEGSPPTNTGVLVFLVLLVVATRKPR